MSGVSRESFHETVQKYEHLHDDSGSNAEQRKAQYADLVNQYYDLVTDFYTFGWGEHFHFAPRRQTESFKASLKRHERFLASKLDLAPGKEALDVGCGIGGPMRHIARHTGARIVGVNNNDYQIERGEAITEKQGLSGQVRFLKADFMNLPLEDDRFDAVYTIEASCHAPDRTALFRELLRVMKPGATFAGYEWCLTDAFDPNDATHRAIKKDIEVGNGLPELTPTTVVDRALRDAGFELVETDDLAPTADPATPWYAPLTGREKNLASLPRTPLGRRLTRTATGVLERLKLAPEGTSKVSDFLNAGADALVAGGELGLFTPMYFFAARKPR